ncbi:MAG: type II toxin-antitoxin system Phd/YefM family antitoxin [Eubacteriales bacterium]
MDLRKVFDCMISVSELGRGQASRVIQSVSETGNPYIVVKNNKPQAVIISLTEYVELTQLQDKLNKINQENYSVSGYSTLSPNESTPLRRNALTEAEINIFLNNEEND